MAKSELKKAPYFLQWVISLLYDRYYPFLMHRDFFDEEVCAIVVIFAGKKEGKISTHCFEAMSPLGD